MGIIGGQRPDLTPAHLAALVTGGIPVVSKLLAAFGVWAPNAAQQGALSDAVSWGVPLAGLLLLGDTGVRAARNAKDARVEAALVAHGAGAGQHDEAAAEALTDEERALLDGGEDLPDDETEFASPPPDESNVPVQPSQTGLAP